MWLIARLWLQLGARSDLAQIHQILLSQPSMKNVGEFRCFRKVENQLFTSTLTFVKVLNLTLHTGGVASSILAAPTTALSSRHKKAA